MGLFDNTLGMGNGSIVDSGFSLCYYLFWLPVHPFGGGKGPLANKGLTFAVFSLGKLYSSREDEDQSVVLIFNSFTDSSLEVISSPFFGPYLYRLRFLFFLSLPAFTTTILGAEAPATGCFFFSLLILLSEVREPLLVSLSSECFELDGISLDLDLLEDESLSCSVFVSFLDDFFFFFDFFLSFLWRFSKDFSDLSSENRYLVEISFLSFFFFAFLSLFL